uniref:Fatty acid synthase n=1 Tax=Cacopsylla melanoneura TaxID=428564 RepID=A0A8D9A8C4_9HEMI
MAKVVISGIGGSFPKCEHLEEFKTALYQRTNLITNVQSEEWTGNLKVPHHLGRDKNYLNFDHSFLSINFNLANTMDKMTKSLIRHGYTAILDAGYSPAELRGRNVNVYTHTPVSDDENKNCGGTGYMWSNSPSPILLGVVRTMQANRISAYFDFHGTSVAYIGSHENVFHALKIATEDVASGKCDSCLVGVCNLCVNPHPSLEYQAVGLLTKDTINKPLDDNANGYIRADSTVVFYIQRESEARRNYAEIVNIGSMYFGDRLGTFMSPDEKHMVQILEETYRQCGLTPNDISYLETGSCANKVLDAQELKLIRKVFADRTNPLPIGSVVGNTGFAEACSGFVGMVKAILALTTGIIAPTLHVDKPNAAIDEKLQIVTENMPVKDYVAVNVVGLYGGFSHVILKKPETIPRRKYPVQDNLPRLYMMAARNESDIEVLFKKLNSVERSKYLAATMCDVFRREIKGYMGRCFAIYNDEKMVEQYKPYEGNKRPVWFLFSGMGSQWQAMGKDLMKFPIFANAIAKCDVVLKQHNVDIINILTNEEDTTIYENILHSFVGIAAVQIGLVDMLHAMGIQPDGIIGHSVGELGCAYADGCLTLEQTIYAALVRGKASKEVELVPGMMAAIGLGYKTVKSYIPYDIEVACHNSATSCTLSGPSESVQNFVNVLTRRWVFAKVVNVSNIAYHSRYIKPAAPLLLKYLEEAIPQPKPRSTKWISTSVEEKDWDSDLAKYASPQYFTNNLLSSVYFEEGSLHIPKNAIVIEIAPHALLAPIVKKSLDPETVHIALTNRSKSVNNIQCLLEGIGNLYLNGCEPNVNAIYPDIEYPIPAEVPSISSFLTWDFSVQSITGMDIGYRKSWHKTMVLGICSKPKYQHLLDYKIGDKFLIPPAGYISLVLDFFIKLHPEAKSVAIEHFRTYECDMGVFLRGNCDISITVTRVRGSFAIVAEHQDNVWNPIQCQTKQWLLATGEISTVDKMIPNLPEWRTEIGIMEFEAYLKNLKFSSRENQCVRFLTKYVEGFSGEIFSTGRAFDLIDSCLKVVSIARSNYKTPEIPYFIQRVVINMESVTEYVQGKSVQVFYDPTLNELTSAAVCMQNIRTKEFLLDNPEPSKEHTGPVSYLTSMKFANLDDIDINFVGISSQSSKDEAIVDFSGTMSSGTKVMGIVFYVDSTLQFDRTLLWKFPSSWSLDQAVTVPIVYCMAYLCIVREKTCWRDVTFQRALIHCGDTPLGEACIALALAKKITVYTTVSSDQGRQILLKRFPQLSSSNIFLNTNYNYFVNIGLNHNGQGVHLVVNPLKDKTHFETSWNSLAMNGEMIQIGIEEKNSFGMYRFLNSQSVLTMDSSVVLNQDEATKKQMYKFICEGINDGIIQPISARIEFGQYEQKSLEDSAAGCSYKVIRLNTRQTSLSPTLDVNPHSSYMIIGDTNGKAVCSWLMQRGARKFVFECGNDIRCSQIMPLLKKFGAVGMISRNNCQTFAGTEGLFSDAKGLGDVAAVFAVNLSGDVCNVKLNNIKNVCIEQNNITFLLSLLCSESNYWHFEIPADDSKTLADILPTLDDSLKSMSKYTTLPLEVEDSSDSSLSEGLEPHLVLLDAHLPLDHLDILHNEISKIQTPTFVEQLSQSLKKDLVYNLLPVFFIPGLSKINLKKMIGKMLHPSFLAHIPAGCTMDHIVSHLYKSIKQIQPTGLYTLVAESWAGLYAIKLAEYMENKRDRVNLILLEASPYLLKNIVEENKNILTNEMSLTEYLVQKKGLDVSTKTSLELSSKIILDRVKHYRDISMNQVLKGNCYIVTSDRFLSDSNMKDLYKISNTVSAFLSTPIVSPFQFSSDKAVVRFINEHVAHEWWGAQE